MVGGKSFAPGVWADGGGAVRNGFFERLVFG